MFFTAIVEHIGRHKTDFALYLRRKFIKERQNNGEALQNLYQT